MKPTLKVIVTGPEPTLPIQFVRTLSAIDVTEHERKIPNPLSATKEEAVLLLNTGRAEWDDVAVQGIAVASVKRFDFTWATLVKETHGVIVLLPSGSAAALDNMQRLTRLLARLDVSACLVCVTGADDADGAAAAARAALDTSYEVTRCRPDDALNVQAVIRALISLILPSEQTASQESK